MFKITIQIPMLVMVLMSIWCIFMGILLRTSFISGSYYRKTRAPYIRKLLLFFFSNIYFIFLLILSVIGTAAFVLAGIFFLEANLTRTLILSYSAGFAIPHILDWFYEAGDDFSLLFSRPNQKTRKKKETTRSEETKSSAIASSAARKSQKAVKEFEKALQRTKQSIATLEKKHGDILTNQVKKAWLLHDKILPRLHNQILEIDRRLSKINSSDLDSTEARQRLIQMRTSVLAIMQEVPRAIDAVTPELEAKRLSGQMVQAGQRFSAQLQEIIDFADELHEHLSRQV
ncbi:MAG: hypothetical protein FJ125_00475 [Deltaproteobacteria bacterium]|nr:hypothetical protein [Deltaproteobacteria bacterium]